MRTANNKKVHWFDSGMVQVFLCYTRLFSNKDFVHPNPSKAKFSYLLEPFEC